MFIMINDKTIYKPMFMKRKKIKKGTLLMEITDTLC